MWYVSRTPGTAFGPAGGTFSNVSGKAGLRESLVIVERQNVVAIRGNVEIGIGLAFRGADYAEEFVRGELLISVDGQIGDAGLLALFHFNPNEQIALVALVIIDELTLHFDLMETVRIV